MFPNKDSHHGWVCNRMPVAIWCFFPLWHTKTIPIPLCFGRDEDEALDFAWTPLNLGQVAETEKCILNDEGLMLLCGAKAGEIWKSMCSIHVCSSFLELKGNIWRRAILLGLRLSRNDSCEILWCWVMRLTSPSDWWWIDEWLCLTHLHSSGLKFTRLTDQTRTHPQQKSERSEARLECKYCKQHAHVYIVWWDMIRWWSHKMHETVLLLCSHVQILSHLAWYIKPAHDAPGALLLEFAFGPALRHRGGAGGRYFNWRREHVPQCYRALNWTTESFERTDFILHDTSPHLHDRAFSLWTKSFRNGLQSLCHCAPAAQFFLWQAFCRCIWVTALGMQQTSLFRIDQRS